MSREAAIRQTHAALTLEVLEALANKGLLRRAQKDLERGEVAAFEMNESGLITSVSGQQVTLIEAGPAKATCSCPAPGVCQHIVAACLKLMQDPVAASTASAYEEWSAFTEADLLAAFGLPTLRSAYELSLAHEPEIVRGSVVTVRFATLNAEVVALPGAGLTGIIVNGLTERKHSQLAAAALLSVRRAAGIAWEPPVNVKEGAAPMHREEALKSVASLIEEAAGNGLARLSTAMVERFDALSISAQTAELHRLSLLLHRIATQMGDWLHKRPHADLGQIFGEMATAYALVHAAPHLAGVGRDSYIEVGSLDLTGVAAWPWRTPSGYEGLTLLFWDSTNGVWNTWTDARPRAFQGGFSALARYSQPGPWDGAESPARLVDSRFRLMSAKRNRWGRLSSSAQTKALVTSRADLSRLPACDDWTALEVTPSPGLRERDPRLAYQILCPDNWVRQPYDPISQCLSWRLHDRHGHVIEMRLAFDDLTETAIKRLEALSAADLKNARLLGRCLPVQGRVLVQPLALICDGQASSLHLANVKSAGSTPSVVAPIPEDEDQDEVEIEVPATCQSAISDLIFAAISSTEWLVESGFGSRNSQVAERLDELAEQAATLGLPKLQKLLSAAPSTRNCLRLRWILGVMQRSSPH
jgi:hypothetical protein